MQGTELSHRVKVAAVEREKKPAYIRRRSPPEHEDDKDLQGSVMRLVVLGHEGTNGCASMQAAFSGAARRVVIATGGAAKPDKREQS